MNVGLLHCDSLITVPDVLLAVTPSAVGKLDTPVMVNLSNLSVKQLRKSFKYAQIFRRLRRAVRRYAPGSGRDSGTLVLYKRSFFQVGPPVLQRGSLR